MAMESTASEAVAFELPADTVNETNVNADIIPISTSLANSDGTNSVTEPPNGINITHVNPGLIYPSMLTAPATLRKTCLCRCDSSIYALDSDCRCDARCSCAEGCAV